MEEDVPQTNEKEETQPEAEEEVEEDKKTEKTIVDKAREEREKLDKATENLKAENDRLELLQANKALGGSAEAGQGAPAKLDDVEYAKAVQEGKVPISDFLEPPR